MSKESFISFARVHPELAKEVLRGNASWQQFYEIYEIYGENHSIWNQFMKKDSIDLNSFKDVFAAMKKIDLNQVQEGIGNLQKTIGYLQDLGITNQRR